MVYPDLRNLRESGSETSPDATEAPGAERLSSGEARGLDRQPIWPPSQCHPLRRHRTIRRYRHTVGVPRATGDFGSAASPNNEPYLTKIW